MPTRSAGILLYRQTGTEPEVLLVHPGGPYFARKDAGAWTIPKGEIQPGEDSLAAAQREFSEETGFSLGEGRSFVALGTRQSGQKLVEAWAVEGDADPSRLVSNTFALEWPPRSGRLRDFPEIDRAAWFTFAEAARKIIKGQTQVLEALEAHLRGEATAR